MADPLSLLRVTGWLSTSCPRMPGVSRGTQASPGGPALHPPRLRHGVASERRVDGVRSAERFARALMPLAGRGRGAAAQEESTWSGRGRPSGGSMDLMEPTSRTSVQIL